MYKRWIVVLATILIGFSVGCGEKPKVTRPEDTPDKLDVQGAPQSSAKAPETPPLEP